MRRHHRSPAVVVSRHGAVDLPLRNAEGSQSSWLLHFSAPLHGCVKMPPQSVLLQGEHMISGIGSMVTLPDPVVLELVGAPGAAAPMAARRCFRFSVASTGPVLIFLNS